MYSKPKLERFGSLRELTQVGWNQGSDTFSIWNITVSTPTQRSPQPRSS